MRYIIGICKMIVEDFGIIISKDFNFLKTIKNLKFFLTVLDLINY